jgi:hypothetical protein
MHEGGGAHWEELTAVLPLDCKPIRRGSYMAIGRWIRVESSNPSKFI